MGLEGVSFASGCICWRLEVDVTGTCHSERVTNDPEGDLNVQTCRALYEVECASIRLSTFLLISWYPSIRLQHFRT